MFLKAGTKSPAQLVEMAEELGVARGTQEPVWNGTAFEPRLMMPLCLSYDHRVIDGANGARFLRWIATALEQPFVLSLEG